MSTTGSNYQLFRQLRDDETGVAVMEYAIMLALIGLAVAGFSLGLSDGVVGVFSRLVGILTPSA